MALISTRASAAAHARIPATPPPNAGYRSPKPRDLASASSCFVSALDRSASGAPAAPGPDSSFGSSSSKGVTLGGRRKHSTQRVKNSVLVQKGFLNPITDPKCNPKPQNSLIYPGQIPPRFCHSWQLLLRVLLLPHQQSSPLRGPRPLRAPRGP